MDNFPENNNTPEEEPPTSTEPAVPPIQETTEPQQSSENAEGTPEPYSFYPMYPFEPPKKPWLTVKDVKPERGYNPYRDENSVFKSIYEANPNAFKGAEQLETEDDYQYHSRRYSEYTYTKNEAKKKLRNSLSFAALLTLMFVVLGFGIQIILLFALDGVSSAMTEREYEAFIDIVNYVLMGIQYLAIFPLILLVGTLGRKCKCRTFFHRPETSALFTFRWCIISLGTTYIVGIVFDNIFSVLQDMGMNVNDLSSPLPTEPLELALYGLFTVICAPIFEELLFRGIMLNRLKKYGELFACIVSGVLFGLIHQNHQQMFYAAALGMIFAIMDIKAGSIIPSVIAHMVVNGFSFLNTLIAAPTNYNEVYFGDGSVEMLDGPMWALFGMSLLNLLLLLVMAAAIVLLIIEFIKVPDTFRLRKGDSMLSSNEKANAFFSSPVMIITLIALAGMIFLNSFLPVDAIANFIESLESSLPTTPVQ